MPRSRQAKHNAKKRAWRRAQRLCRDCGAPSLSYRCKACNEKRRAYAKNGPRPGVQAGCRIMISEFQFEGRTIRLQPAKSFPVRKQDGQLVVGGTDQFESVRIEATDRALLYEALVTDIMPFLWKVYALADDEALSERALAIKRDLLKRTR